MVGRAIVERKNFASRGKNQKSNAYGSVSDPPNRSSAEAAPRPARPAGDAPSGPGAGSGATSNLTDLPVRLRFEVTLAGGSGSPTFRLTVRFFGFGFATPPLGPAEGAFLGGAAGGRPDLAFGGLGATFFFLTEAAGLALGAAAGLGALDALAAAAAPAFRAYRASGGRLAAAGAGRGAGPSDSESETKA